MKTEDCTVAMLEAEISLLRVERANAGKRAMRAEQRVDSLLELIDRATVTLRNDLFKDRVRNALLCLEEARDYEA